MGWWSDFFNPKPYSAHTEFKCDVPMPKVKPTKDSGVILPVGTVYVPPKDISEPVFAIVATMLKYPSRFKLKSQEENADHYSFNNTYTIMDIKTRQELTATSKNYYHSFSSRSNYSYSWKWLTKDESELLRETFVKINKTKRERIDSIQRAKMKGIYQ